MNTESSQLRGIEKIWYGDSLVSLMLTPLSWLFAVVTRFRRFLYQKNLLRSVQHPVPVIVVGNINVGGTGKTPVVVWLVEALRARGRRPGVVSRGYGGRQRAAGLLPESPDPLQFGDEPSLVRKRTGVPVAVGASRNAAVSRLVETGDIDCVVSDDGMQHYAMSRDAEINVVDAARVFGSGRLLPAGPLREPLSRLASVDIVLWNGANDDRQSFTLRFADCQSVTGTETRPLESFRGQTVHALAGIGHPERFFTMLETAGLTITRHAFPDHHQYGLVDLSFVGSAPILMTEKDAVKCAALGLTHAWYVPVTAEMSDSASSELGRLLDRLGLIAKHTG